MPAASHIADVMAAVRDRVRSLKPLFDPMDVEIAHPAQFHPRVISDTHLVTLFVYRIEPDHRAMIATPERGMAVRLQVMITVYGGEREDSSESIGSLELRILSHIMRLFVEQPRLGPIRLRETLPAGPMAAFVTTGITVEAQQLSLDMEETNHIWTTQGDTPYRTSLVYSFNYAVVTPLAAAGDGPPVLRTQIAPPGGPASPADIGIDPGFAQPPEADAPALGALTMRDDSTGQPRLIASLSLAPGAGNITLRLVAVTEAAAAFDLIVQRFDIVSGTWAAVVASPPQITSVARHALIANPIPAGTDVSFARPSGPALIRLSLQHATRPEAYSISPAHVTVEAAP